MLAHGARAADQTYMLFGNTLLSKTYAELMQLDPAQLVSMSCLRLHGLEKHILCTQWRRS